MDEILLEEKVDKVIKESGIIFGGMKLYKAYRELLIKSIKIGESVETGRKERKENGDTAD